MPKFKLNRDYALVSLQGASVDIKKNEPFFAPEFLRKELENLGAEEVGGNVVTEGDKPEDVAAQRKKAFEDYALKHGTDKVPTIKDLADAGVHFENAAERDEAWEAFKKG